MTTGHHIPAQDGLPEHQKFFDLMMMNPSAITGSDMEWIRETALAHPEYLTRGISGVGGKSILFVVSGVPFQAEAWSDKHLKVLEILLSAGANPKIRYNYSQSSFPPSWTPPRSWNRTIKGGTPLHAVSNIEAARLLVEAGADVNATNEDGDTPLDILHAVGAIAAANYLESQGAKNRITPTEWPAMYAPGESPEPTLSLFDAIDKNDIENVRRNIAYAPEQLEQTDDRGNTPLARTMLTSGGVFYASEPWSGQFDFHYSRTEIFQFLILAGANPHVDVHDDGGRKKTLLYCAARKGLPVLVKSLIDHDADLGKPNIPSPKGENYRQFGDRHTPILGAITSGSNASIQAILDAGLPWDWTVESHRTDDYGTLLHLAVMSGNAGLTEKLLDAGADVNAVNQSGRTPLMCTNGLAVERVRVPMIDMLLRRGTNVNIKDNQGHSCLGHVIDVESVEKIIHAGAVVSWDDPFPMESAAIRGNAEVFNLLVEVAEGLERAPKDQLLMAAIRGQNTDIILKLVEADANVNRPGDDSPLIYAAREIWVKPEVVKVLLEAGADPNIRSPRYGTPLNAIIGWSNQLEKAKLLLHAGADPHIKNSDGISLIEVLKGNQKTYQGGSGNWLNELIEFCDAHGNQTR